ncbi:hypothetical protein DRN97_01745 [Methanosarcinales archaeon]|nr:MAG: hypothetical protein DRN97_01745 [Methanosarcinales archaeon]
MKAGVKGVGLRDALTAFLTKIPMVERPRRHVPLKTKLAFTISILILYFALGNIPLFGLSPESLYLFGRWRTIFAGDRFSLTALGIMPIVAASLILQILAGPKIMKLDLTDPWDQAFYLNIQKLLVVVFAAFISLTYVVGFYKPDPGIASLLGVSLQVLSAMLFIQVFIGGMLIYFMEEVVSRWGIRSGVSLFILAGVSQQVITGLISPIQVGGWAVGVIPRWIQIAREVAPYEILLEGGITFLFANHLIALITTIAMFFLMIYLVSAHIELKIPGLHSGRIRGRIIIPIKFVHFTYAIIIPLMFASSILPTIQSFGRMFYSHGITIFGTYDD